MNDEKKQAPLHAVELLVADHTHFGRECKKGEVIELRKDQADRLIAAGSAKASTKAASHG